MTTALDDLLATAGPAPTNWGPSIFEGLTLDSLRANTEALRAKWDARIADLREKAKSGGQDDQIALFMAEARNPAILVGPGPVLEWIASIPASAAAARGLVSLPVIQSPHLRPGQAMLIDQSVLLLFGSPSPLEVKPGNSVVPLDLFGSTPAAGSPR